MRTAEERVKYLKNISSNFNFHLVLPEQNLTSEEECKDLAPEEFERFVTDFPGKSVKMSISETQKGNKIGGILFYIFRQKP